MSLSSKRKSSVIWNHYSVIDSFFAKCDICKSTLSYKSSLSNLKKHIYAKHPTIVIGNNIRLKASQRFSCNSQISNNNNGHSNNIDAITSNSQAGRNITDQNLLQSTLDATKKIDDAVLQLITKDFQPFRIVEDKGFKNLIKILNPSYNLPSRTRLSETLLPALYEQTLKEMKNEAKTIVKCCLTTDCWASINNESFIAVTVHFINRKFELRTLLLGCINLKNAYTSISLAKKLTDIVNEWELTDKITIAISDNAANIKCAIKSHLDWNHFECLAHTINLITLESLKSLSPILDKIRQIVAHLKRSSSANQKFLLYQTNKKENGKVAKKLIIDVVTRWNSTFLMLERIFELQDAVKATIVLAEKDLPILTIEEWAIIGDAIKCLKHFAHFGKIVSGEKYMSASLVIVLVNGLITVMKKIETESKSNEKVKKLILDLKAGVDKRLGNIENNNTLCLATFLDPRFKNYSFIDTIKAKQIKDIVINKIAARSIDNENVVNDLERARLEFEEDSIWSHYNNTAYQNKEDKGLGISCATLEVERYMEEILLPKNGDPLVWWSLNKHNFPNLSELAIEYLCAMAISVPYERTCSKAGLIYNEKRSRLKSKYVECILFINQNT